MACQEKNLIMKFISKQLRKLNPKSMQVRILGPYPICNKIAI